MINNKSNAKYNSELLFHHHAYQFSNSRAAKDFIKYLEWLLPYQCENIELQYKIIDCSIESNGVCYIGLGYFHFDEKIGYATRIDLSISTTPSFMPVYGESCFKTPFFTTQDRCLRLLDTISRRSLINLKLAYI